MSNQGAGIIATIVTGVIVGLVLLAVEYGLFQSDDDDPGPIGPGTIVIPSFPQEPPSITLSMGSGPAGTQLTVDGEGFAPSETVVIRFHTEEVARVQTDDDGAFAAAQVRVPSDWMFDGQFDFIATGLTSIRTATMPFRVT